MIDMDYLRQQFAEKLQKENDFDAAFTKAMWLAFKAGYAAGLESGKEDTEDDKA